ncbi:hypothetical protein EV715DRAFT_297103 [Schizophyllum commune]
MAVTPPPPSPPLCLTIPKYGNDADQWDITNLESRVEIGLEAAPMVVLVFGAPTFREHLLAGAQDRDPKTSECEFAARKDNKYGERAAADDEHGGRARGIGIGFISTVG